MVAASGTRDAELDRANGHRGHPLGKRGIYAVSLHKVREAVTTHTSDCSGETAGILPQPKTGPGCRPGPVIVASSFKRMEVAGVECSSPARSITIASRASTRNLLTGQFMADPNCFLNQKIARIDVARLCGPLRHQGQYE
jgi:hypothetical protein